MGADTRNRIHCPYPQRVPAPLHQPPMVVNIVTSELNGGGATPSASAGYGVDNAGRD